MEFIYSLVESGFRRTEWCTEYRMKSVVIPRVEFGKVNRNKVIVFVIASDPVFLVGLNWTESLPCLSYNTHFNYYISSYHFSPSAVQHYSSNTISFLYKCSE